MTSKGVPVAAVMIRPSPVNTWTKTDKLAVRTKGSPTDTQLGSKLCRSGITELDKPMVSERVMIVKLSFPSVRVLLSSNSSAADVRGTDRGESNREGLGRGRYAAGARQHHSPHGSARRTSVM